MAVIYGVLVSFVCTVALKNETRQTTMMIPIISGAESSRMNIAAHIPLIMGSLFDSLTEESVALMF